MSGSDKKRRTVTIDAHLDERLQESDINASGLINELLSEYFVSGMSEEAALRVRLSNLQQQRQQAKSEKRIAESRLETVDDEIEVVKDQLNNIDRTEKEEVETVVNLVLADNEGISKDQLNPESTIIKHRAEKAGMTPTKFIEAVEERL